MPTDIHEATRRSSYAPHIVVRLCVCIFVWHIRRIQINKPCFLHNQNSLHIVLKSYHGISKFLRSKTTESSYSNRRALIPMGNPKHSLLPSGEILLLICHNLSLIHPLLKPGKNRFHWNKRQISVPVQTPG